MPRGKRTIDRASMTRRGMLAAALGGGITAALAACSNAGAAYPADTPANASATLHLSARTGALRGGTRVVATGTALDAVHTVSVGGAAAALVSAAPDRVVFETPAVDRFVAGAKPLVFTTATGESLARTTWTYRAVDGIDRQLAYVLKYWKQYNPAWSALPDDDCVDFTSQALLQRGWTQQDDWYHESDILDSGAAWRSSTSFRDFMQEHPKLGTALTDAQRSEVKVGDVVQFDWDRSGDRDHTGTVTRVTETGGKWEVYFAGHTIDSDYRSVDDAVTKDHPGGAAYYWSLA